MSIEDDTNRWLLGVRWKQRLWDGRGLTTPSQLKGAGNWRARLEPLGDERLKYVVGVVQCDATADGV